jgi:hypothetical protein
MDNSADIIIDYIKRFLEDKNNDVRFAAADLMVIISN